MSIGLNCKRDRLKTNCFLVSQITRITLENFMSDNLIKTNWNFDWMRNTKFWFAFCLSHELRWRIMQIKLNGLFLCCVGYHFQVSHIKSLTLMKWGGEFFWCIHITLIDIKLFETSELNYKVTDFKEFSILIKDFH